MPSDIYMKRVDYLLGQSEAADYLQELRTEVEKLAKRANQRLREIEKQGINESSRAYQVTARKVYDGLPGYVETKAGNIAFDRSLKNKTIQDLEGELSELQHFLDPGNLLFGGGNCFKVPRLRSNIIKFCDYGIVYYFF